ncbi:MAG: hypothetical protein HRT45_05905 [Bdellovibrionales bacterium]|nr:hypothetical protein [Bdellovibrionales bacterium]
MKKVVIKSLAALAMLLSSCQSLANPAGLRSRLLCSTHLNPVRQVMPFAIVHGSQLGDTHFVNQPPGILERVSLDGNFAYHDGFSDLVTPVSQRFKFDHPVQVVDLAIKARDKLGVNFDNLRAAYQQWKPVAARTPWLESLRTDLLNSIHEDVPEVTITELLNTQRNLIAMFSRLEWHSRKQHILFGIDTTVWRGPIGANMELPGPVPEEETFRSLVVSPTLQALESLYLSYSNQGPERARIVPQVVRQDLSETNRYVRFLISRYVKPMGYLQVLTSQSAAEPLHIEEAWRDLVSEFVARKPGELIAEMGRLHVVYPEDEVADHYSALMGDENITDKKSWANGVVTHMLFQKSLAWINSDAKLDRLFLQINTGVEAVMLRSGIPLHFAERLELPKTFEHQKYPEVIYKFDPEALLKIEEYMMLKVVQEWLLATQSQVYLNTIAPEVVGDRSLLKFKANELPALERLGLYQALFAKNPEGAEQFTEFENDLGIYVLPEEVLTLIEIIDSRLQLYKRPR